MSRGCASVDCTDRTQPSSGDQGGDPHSPACSALCKPGRLTPPPTRSARFVPAAGRNHPLLTSHGIFPSDPISGPWLIVSCIRAKVHAFCRLPLLAYLCRRGGQRILQGKSNSPRQTMEELGFLSHKYCAGSRGKESSEKAPQGYY